MLYVEQSLGPGEQLIRVGQFHWVYTAKAISWIVFGFIAALAILFVPVYFLYEGLPFTKYFHAVAELHPGIRIGAFVTFLMGIFFFASMMVRKATTEIAVTDKRMILKTGLVARHVNEISVDRIESVEVIQGILGRMLGYGTIAARGVGIGVIGLPTIDSPILFRQAIQEVQAYAAKGGR